MVTEPIVPEMLEAKTRPAAFVPGTLRSSTLSALLSRQATKKTLFLAGDALAVVAAHNAAEFLVRRSLHAPAEFLNPAAYYLFYVPFFAALLQVLEGYKSPDLRRPEKELEISFKGVSISFVALACANFVFFKTSGFSRYLLVSWYVLTLGFLLATRFGLRACYSALWRRGLARQKALFIGSAAAFDEFMRRLTIQRCAVYDVAGPVSASLSPADDWVALARCYGAQALILNLDHTGAQASSRVFDTIRACRRQNIEVEIYSRLFGTTELCYERDEFSGYFHFYAPSVASRAVQQGAKACLDIFIGILGSIVTLALLPLIALLTKTEDGGPIFYEQQFIAPGGVVRHYLKFRTMVVDAQQILASSPAMRAEFERSFKLKKDPRVLRVGRFLRKYSIDEFPEFFSLLARKLSFVGPRTICLEEARRYGVDLPKLLSVKPGLTGFWQVMGRQDTTYEERIQMDMFYIQHWSIWLDLIIIGKTFWKVLHGDGAY